MRRFVCVVMCVLWSGCGDNEHPDGSIVFDKTPAAVTNQTKASFEFHVEGGATDAKFRCAVDHGTAATCSSPFVVDVTDGDHVIEVSTVDYVGSATETWRVDTVAPDTVITEQPMMFDSSGMPMFAFAGVPAEDAKTFECALDAESFATCTSPKTIAATADGTHTFRVRAIDEAGNVDPTPAAVL